MSERLTGRMLLGLMAVALICGPLAGTAMAVPVTNGLELWLDASDLSSLNLDASDKVLQWQDKSGGWVFVGFNSCEGTGSDVTVSPEQVAWLSKRVRKIDRDRPIALFAHHPFNPHTKNYRVKNAEEVLGLFGDHNLKLVATGHWHGNQVETRDGILFTTTACCSSTRGNFDDTTAKGYRLFHFDKKEVQTEFVTVQA